NKKVPVVPMEAITFAPQYMSITGLSLTPDSVYVYGDPARLETIDRIFTVPLRLNNLSSPKKGTVKVAQLVGVRISDPEVSYFIDVDRYVQLSQEVVIKAINVPKDVDFKIFPASTEVDFRAVFPLIGSVPKISLVIDYNDYLASISGKCVPRLEDELPLGFFNMEARTKIFDCISEIK
ncbi:MAG: hypothetical protein HUJ95_05860, partial [Bacteroidales bacterium]|nr:hypothetical protein [Bacteroidales bacterium]